MPSRLLTLNDAARALGITPSALRHAIARGRLQAEKIGRDWLVDEAEIAFYELRTERKGRPRKFENRGQV